MIKRGTPANVSRLFYLPVSTQPFLIWIFPSFFVEIDNLALLWPCGTEYFFILLFLNCRGTPFFHFLSRFGSLGLRGALHFWSFYLPRGFFFDSFPGTFAWLVHVNVWGSALSLWRAAGYGQAHPRGAVPFPWGGVAGEWGVQLVEHCDCIIWFWLIKFLTVWEVQSEQFRPLKLRLCGESNGESAEPFVYWASILGINSRGQKYWCID